MSACCPATSEPAREGTPGTGAMKKIGDTSVYITGPANASAGILAYPDIFGMDSGRSKEDADAIGQLGYAVVLIDLTDGDYLDPNGDWGSQMSSWVQKYTFEGQFSKRIADAVSYLKNEAKVERVASYGYCWGSWVGATQSAQATPVVSGHISFHPTWMIEGMLKGDGAVDKLAENVKVPQLLMAAGDDPEFVKPGGSVEKILKARPDIGGQSQVDAFPDMKHGWVHRGDLNDPATKEAVMKAWHGAVSFLKMVCPV